jgi:hypothetical protein
MQTFNVNCRLAQNVAQNPSVSDYICLRIFTIYFLVGSYKTEQIVLAFVMCDEVRILLLNRVNLLVTGYVEF